jgi:hypothetical protein
METALLHVFAGSAAEGIARTQYTAAGGRQHDGPWLSDFLALRHVGEAVSLPLAPTSLPVCA